MLSKAYMKGNEKTLSKMKKMKLGNKSGKMDGKNAPAELGLEPSKEAKMRMFSKKKH